MRTAYPSVWMPLLLAASGCASVPVSYFTLNPPAASLPMEPARPCCTIEIRSVRIPPDADRPELVVRRSDEQVTILSNELWIAPLGDEVNSALLNDIRRKLPRATTTQVTRTFSFILSVEVRRFESQPAKYSLIDVAWRAIPADDPKHAVPECETLARVDVAGGVSGLVHGYQQAISRVAASIAASIVAAEKNGEVVCMSLQS